jgi:VWFA-related protein
MGPWTRAAALPSLALAAAVARSQQEAPGARAELVRLDAVVTDAQGRPVRDLTREDFEVREDGRPQRLVHFLFVGSPTGATGGGAAEAGAQVAPAAGAPAPPPAAPGPGRHVVIVVDDLHIAPGNLEPTRRALLSFVDEFTAAEDQLALLTTSRASAPLALGRDRAALRQALASLAYREAGAAPARGSQMTAAQAELILRGDLSAVQLGAQALIAEPGSVFDSASPQAAVEGPAVAAPAGLGAAAGDARERAAEQEARRQARGVLNEALRFSVASLGALADVLRGLAPLPGRKLCLLVSDGFLYGAGTSEERTRELRSVVDAATRSGAVVYALDPRGLTTGGGDASVAGLGAAPGLRERVERLSGQLRRETLATLAGDTGGILVSGTNDLETGLRRMLADNEAYYLMAYEPANRKRDGKFRRIELRLPRRSGLTVRTRRGYFAPDDKAPTRAAARATAPAVSNLDPVAARELLATPLPAAPQPAEVLPVRLAADYLDLPPDGSQAIVRAHVALDKLTWARVDGRRRVGVELAGGVYDETGALVGEPFGRRAAFDVTPEEHARALAKGLRYQHQLALPVGRYQVRIVARELDGIRLGGSTLALEVPDLGAGTLAVSGLFLSSSSSGAPGAGGEVLRDAHALRRFRRSETLFFQLYVYNPKRDDAGHGDVVLQAQVRSATRLVAATQALPAALASRDGAPLQETNGIPLESLEPGSYELRVVVVDRKAGATVDRRLDFAVE